MSFQEDDIATIDALRRCNRLLQGYKTCLKVVSHLSETWFICITVYICIDRMASVCGEPIY